MASVCFGCLFVCLRFADHNSYDALALTCKSVKIPPDDMCVCALPFFFFTISLPRHFRIIIVYVRTWPVGRSNVLLSRLTCKLQAVIVAPNDGFLYANCLYSCSVTLNIMHNHFADIRSLIFIARNLFSALAFLWMPFSLLSLSFLCGLFIIVSFVFLFAGHILP